MLKNCPQCGCLFDDQYGRICRACLDKEERDFKTIKEYLHRHPGAGLMQIGKETGISEKRILGFLKSGRLVISVGKAQQLLKCERCGRSITEGRYCEECCQLLSRLFDQVAGNDQKSNVSPETTERKNFTSHFQK